MIRNLKSIYNLEKVTLKQIYNFLLDFKLKNDPYDISFPPKYKLLKCEEREPDLNWNKAWNNVKIRGLSDSISSFVLKMIWNILPTEKRIARIYNGNGNCKFCLEKRNETVEGNIEHFLVQCPENCGLTEKLINLIRPLSNINSKNLVSFSVEIRLINEYPILWLLANYLMNLWNLKKANKFSKIKLKIQLITDISMQKKCVE